MRILIVHRNFFVDGGDSRYTIELAKLLSSKGHKIEIFTIEDSNNLDLGYKIHQLPNPFGGKKHTRFNALNVKQKIVYGFRSIYSRRAYRFAYALFQREKYDLIHVNNIHHVLTPSILLAAADNKIPVIWTLHDYKTICPSSDLYTHGAVCERCIKGKYYHSLINCCKRDSWVASFNVMIGAYVHQWLDIHKIPKIYIAPSRFLQEKIIQSGIEENRTIVIPNFTSQRPMQKHGVVQEGILFFGNISEVKGIRVLLNVAKRLKRIPITIIGNGELKAEIINYLADGNQNIRYLDFLNTNALEEEILRSRFVVVPSQWHEIFGLNIIESFALGRTVVASRRGGIPEIVKHDVNGMLVDDVSSIDQWCKAIGELYFDAKRLELYSSNAQTTVKENFSPDKYYHNLLTVYKGLEGN